MKNIEIELKYRLADLEKMRDNILQLNAEFIKQFHCVDTYYIVPKNPEGRKYLRLREQDDTAELNYHVAISDLRTDEWETQIDSAATMSVILQELGFKVDVVIDKIRKTYHYKNSEIVLDDVKDLGPFVEIESPSVEELAAIAKELKLTESQVIRGAGYPDLLREKNVQS